MNPFLRKILGAVVVTVASIYGLFTVFGVINFFSDSGGRGLSDIAIEVLFGSLMSALGVYYGIKLFRSGTAEKIPENLIEVLPGESILLDVKIDINEYRKLILWLTYSNPLMIFITIIGLITFIRAITNPDVESYLFFFGLCVLLIPVATFFQAGKNYKSNKAFNENLSYEFNLEDIIVKGESINSTSKWNSLFKVVETSNWFLLYNSKQTAYFIPKGRFASEEQKEKFRAIVWSVEGIKKDLKKRKVQE